MMSAKWFKYLKQETIRRRDAEIAISKLQCENDLRQIERAEMDWRRKHGGQLPKTEPIARLILTYLPFDLPLSIDDCLEEVQSNIDRKLTRSGVRKTLFRLAQRGTILRLGSHQFDCKYLLPNPALIVNLLDEFRPKNALLALAIVAEKTGPVSQPKDLEVLLERLIDQPGRTPLDKTG